MTTEYITTLDLEPYFVDRDTGAPLAGGYVQAWEDANRTTPKPLFEKQNIGADPVTGQPIYQFIELPNPIILSGVGTFQDANGNNIAVYYYPFDAEGNEQLYYIAVFNSLGVQQFTREGWGFNSSNGSGGPTGSGSGTFDNMILNPQFAVVDFDLPEGITFNYTGSATDVVPIGPLWDLLVSHTGAGTVIVNRVSIAGISNFVTNPPYVLSVTGGANLSGLQLRQRLLHNPGIWSATEQDINGYVASYILLGPNSAATMSYAPSVGAPTELLAANNLAAGYRGFSATVELPPSANTDTADAGYVDILITLPTTATTLLSSIQVLGIDTNIQGIDYLQEPVNKQIALLAPSSGGSNGAGTAGSSYLVGWDFPLNPAQALGPTIAAQAVGANKSYYAWDQTIIFQSANSGVTISQDASGALKTLAAPVGGTQLALIQYIPAPQAIEMLSRPKCVGISANASVATNATVSLWYTKTTLPSTVASNNSIVLTLDANGHPATLNGTWTEVSRSNLGNAEITIEPNALANFNFYAMSGWDMEGVTDINSATFFAIVIGTQLMPHNSYVLWQSVSCQDGSVASPPLTKTLSQVLLDCSYYYASSFPAGIVPATQTTIAAGVQTGYAIPVGGASGIFFAHQFTFPVKMNAIPTTLTIFNPVNNNNLVYCLGNTADSSSTHLDYFSASDFYLEAHQSSGNGGLCAFNYTADARLGQ